MRALEAEIGSHPWKWKPETVYLGGGTPSQMAPESLARLLSRVPGRPWAEATIEAAPGTITNEKITAWMACGINRVSMGVQSFVQRELSRTGRKHTAELVDREVGLLRERGMKNFNIDLIAGLPGQGRQSWNQSLEWIKRLEPPHVSVYMLEVDEDSRLGQEVLLNGKRYGAPEVPTDGMIADFYEMAAYELRRMGILRYEISNFALPGFESLHNLKYWRLEPYVGLGSDAHSYDGSTRLENVDAAVEYVDRWEAAKSVRAATTPANRSEEKFFVGLRLTEGVRPEPQEWTKFDEPIGRFLMAGLLELDGEVLRLTDRGVLLSNEVFEEFVGIE